MRIHRLLLIAACFFSLSEPMSQAADLDPLLETLQAVGPSGAGNPEARQAWAQLVGANADQLPVILAALDDAGPLAANWIRTAIDAIAERQLRSGDRLPAAELESFVLDTHHAPKARRLAYEWLLRVDPNAENRLIPGMLDDPSVELRRDAVALLIAEATRAAELGDPAKAVKLYRRALTSARDSNQVRLLADRLRKADQEVDLARHFGYVVSWKLIGPFDNSDEKGYDVVYPPERKLDPRASHPGKHGNVKWIDHQTDHEYGHVDLNKAIEEEKDVVTYAMAEFVSQQRLEVDFRVSSQNAVKLWVNGTLADEHNVYHAGGQMDQYTSRATLEPGRNTILLKVCQNGQTQDWARGWGFQLRVCDSTGGAVLSADRKK